MLGVLLACAALIGPDAGPADDSALVARLGSARFADRESAGAALLGRGRDALPTLRSAANHCDPEVRARVESILRQVERSMVLQATPIVLDFRDAPLGDVLRRINGRSGLNFSVSSEDDPAWAGRRVTLEAAGPVPFWAAVDRVCEAGGLRPALGSPPAPGQRDDAFAFRDEADAPGYVSDSGPFRAQLASIAYQSEVALSRPRPAQAASGGLSVEGNVRPRREMYCQLLVAAEPRLAITQDGPIRLVEAVDERGQSLIPPGLPPMLSRSSGYFGMNPTPLVRFRVDLARPDDPGRRIARLKGSVPLLVSARKPNPLVVPLDGPAGRVHRDEGIELAIREFRPGLGDRPATIELALLSKQDRSPADEADRPDQVPSASDVPQQQIEVLDARGNALAWFPSATRYEGHETRLTLTVPSSGSPASPATIRYHGITWVATEVGFEFLDVPMP